MDLLDPFSCQPHHIAFDRLKFHTPFPCPGTQSINIPRKFYCVFFILNFTITNLVISKKSFYTLRHQLQSANISHSMQNKLLFKIDYVCKIPPRRGGGGGAGAGSFLAYNLQHTKFENSRLGFIKSVHER